MGRELELLQGQSVSVFPVPRLKLEGSCKWEFMCKLRVLPLYTLVFYVCVLLTE